MDDASETVYISGETQDVVTVEFENQPDSGLTITKLDSETKKPLADAVFEVRTDDGTVVGNGNGQYTTDESGTIHLPNLPTDTYIIKEVKAPTGYTLDGTPQTVKLLHGETHSLTFYNEPKGGLIIIKTDEDDGDRLKGAEFEVREMDGTYVGNYTTDKYGIIRLPELSSGWYLVTETKAPDGYQLDDTSHRVEVKDGDTTTLSITNHEQSNIVIRKVDADTGEGLYGSVFVLYDSKNNPIGEYKSNQRGYVYIEDVLDGRYKLREIEAPEGYLLDDDYKTIYVRYGSSSEVRWENTAVKGQIQVQKFAEDNNPVTGQTAGTPLSGAVFEIAHYRSGTVAGYITTDSRGIAASKPLPLGRYIVREVTAPPYYALSGETYDIEIEYTGQIVKLSAYNESAVLDVSIAKTGLREVLSGSNMEYQFMVANTSNVPLERFYWHDRIPTDVTTATHLTTGTYNQRLNYRVLYKTNYNDYRVLASNLLTSNNYAFALNTIPLMGGEVVTDIYFEFGTVPVGFQSITKPTIEVIVKPYTITGYQIINRADVGGQYEKVWETAQSNWVTTTRNLSPTITLPKTGY